MEDKASSWVTRTRFSRTVYYRLGDLPLISDGQVERFSSLKSRPSSSLCDHKPEPTKSKSRITQKPIQIQRSESPLPKTVLPDTFQEAQSDRKRFSTPLLQRPQRAQRTQANEHSSKVVKSNSSPIKRRSSSPVSKAKTWTKYFDHSGGRVTSVVEAADEWVVDLSKLFLGLRFAHGAHSRLYHGVYKDEPVAVKIIRVPDDDEHGDLGVRLEKQFYREVALLSRLHHQHVIRFVAACRDPPVFCIVTEYLSEGSLRAYLHKLEHKSLPLAKLVAIALDIARGMEYIHSQGVIHRDLKPENVLINEEFHMKIADFGIACEEASCDSLSDDPGTFRWMAPEMIRHKPYGRKVDVYSFGLMLWELVTGTTPYEDMTPIQAAFAVVNKNVRPLIPEDCPSAMRSLIEQCWSSEPEERPEFGEVVKALEQFESLLANEGTLNLVPSFTCRGQKKGIRRWLQKLSHGHANNLTSFVSKPNARPADAHPGGLAFVTLQQVKM